jgi:hypothetical protein
MSHGDAWAASRWNPCRRAAMTAGLSAPIGAALVGPMSMAGGRDVAAPAGTGTRPGAEARGSDAFLSIP